MLTPLKGAPFAPGEDLTSVEMNILNDEITHAVDGINGGTYVLTAGINFSSLAFPVQFGAVLLNNNATVGIGSTVVISGSPTWVGTITWSGGGIVIGQVSITGGVVAISIGGAASTFDLNSGAAFTAAVGSTTTFNNDPTFSTAHVVTFDGTEHINGTAIVGGSGQLIIDTGTQILINGTFNLATTGHVLSGATFWIDNGANLFMSAGSNIDIAGDVEFGAGSSILIDAGILLTLGGVITPTGAGRKRQRINRPDGTTNVTSNAGTADYFHYSAMTAPRNFILTATGAAQGDEVEISILGVGNANQLTVQDDVAATLIGLSNQAGAPISAHFYFDSGAWVLFTYDIFD